VMFYKAYPRDSLWAGEMLQVEVQGRKVLLVDVDRQVKAYEDRCCHKGVPLSQGRLEGAVLTCSAHEWQYDARTGRGLNPAGVALVQLPVEVRDGHIWVDVPQGDR
jgi:toluene monooxygenase system ferredoxin subunit